MATNQRVDDGREENDHHFYYYFTPSWYQITYLLAAEHAHRALTAEARDRVTSLNEAENWAREVLDIADWVLSSNANGRPSRKRFRSFAYKVPERPGERLEKGFRVFLKETVVPSCLVLWAGVRLERLKLMTQNNRILDEVPWDAPGAVVGKLLGGTAKLPHRVRYNLACYLSGLSVEPILEEGLPQGLEPTPKAILERAADELDGAMSGLYGHRKERMAVWAWEDPSLRPLVDGLRQRFTEIVGPRRQMDRSARSPESGLAPLRIVGPLSRRLTELDIHSAEQLLKRGASSSARREIAHQAGVSEELVRRWVGVADLITIPGIDALYANLLDAAGISSRRALAGRSPSELAGFLRSLNQVLQVVSRVPSEDMIKSWIASAAEPGAVHTTD